MNKAKKMFQAIATGLLSAALLTACGGGGAPADSTQGGPTDSGSGEAAQETLKLKMAYITKENSAWHLAAERINSILKEKSNGRITVELFPGGQLGNETDMMQQINTGSVDMGIITTAQLSSSSEAFGAWLMPFVVDTHQQAYKLMKSDEANALFDTLTKENVHGLGYLTTGFRYMLSTKPIESKQQLEGLKLRTTPSPTILDYWTALKASPTPMPLTEVYTSLQTGVIDAIDIDSDSLVNEKLTEIAKHMTPDKHMYWAGGVLINKDRWSGLSDEDKKLIEEAVDTAMQENIEYLETSEADLLANYEQKYGITNVYELKDKEQLQQQVQPVIDAWVQKAPEIGKFLEKAKQIAAE
ncbi:TRAP transporter substrate-binding protein [Brevibacillus humidisoli]|uniref:TRAP transporter substrate-binding protein n=1 Tax=Brevibacillus humidisoli TaxID=2895522 RepID=UPI001E2FA755|nr:TRAP transporter substrate-binding protein [Brevibacillus humidisoli]UFJ41400.1 TRAP transporter substrate-binding protein [Brevibacillus humidisoli]